MVSITLSVPEEVREQMQRFSEINWSAFIRKSIEEKTRKLSLKEKLLMQLKEEQDSGFTDWTVEMGRKVKKDSFDKLKKDKLL
jgi:hypothetical protein